MNIQVILLPFAWIVAVALATAGLPAWHNAVQSISESYPMLAPLISNPFSDVFFQFIVPSALVMIAGFSFLRE